MAVPSFNRSFGLLGTAKMTAEDTKKIKRHAFNSLSALNMVQKLLLGYCMVGIYSSTVVRINAGCG